MANIKVSLLGTGGVGKTSIKQVFSGHPMTLDYSATLGTDFTLKDYTYTEGEISENMRFMIYDLAGQDRFKAGRSSFIAGSHAGILVYDVANRTSLEVIPKWLEDFKKVVKANVPIVLVGNKIDLRDGSSEFLSTQDGLRMSEKLQKMIGFGSENKFYFIETSALENLNINDIFDYISAEIYHMFLKGNRVKV